MFLLITTSDGPDLADVFFFSFFFFLNKARMLRRWWFFCGPFSYGGVVPTTFCPDVKPGRRLWATSQENLPLGLCDQLRLRPAAKLSKSFGISVLATIGIILSRQQIAKTLVRLCRCAGWSASLLFAYVKNRVCHNTATHYRKAITLSLETILLNHCLWHNLITLLISIIWYQIGIRYGPA